MAYCTQNDLLLGDVQVSDTVDKNVYVNDAADEIDMAIGHLWATPVDVLNISPVARHSKLLLKRINLSIATGRLVLSLNAGRDDRLHAYGLRMLTEGLTYLAKIVSGEILLDGAPRPEGTPDLNPGVMIVNQDELSAVDAFYDRTMRQPVGSQTTLVWAPGEVTGG